MVLLGESGEKSNDMSTEGVGMEELSRDNDRVEGEEKKEQGVREEKDPRDQEKKENNEISLVKLMVYDFFLWLLAVIFDCFFREIKPRGAFRLPRSGPVIFVAAPHANQFVDGIVLMNLVKRESQRRISFLIAEKSYKRKVIGFFSRCQLSIPVVRAQDHLKRATGTITVDSSNPLVIRGSGTKFLTECSQKGLVALPNSLGASEIVNIISDDELLIKKEFKLNNEKVAMMLAEGTSFKVAPKVDRGDVYRLVFEHLHCGRCLGIFPEGGSHDRTDLLPLKPGVAVMALGAMTQYPNCNVKIVPCGMNYFNAHKFRSRAVVEFGHPIEIPKELIEKYQDPSKSRDSVEELLDIVANGLKAVTVTCKDYETLMVVQAARRLYGGNFAQHLPLPLIVEMNRRLVLGYEAFKDNERVKLVKEKVLAYNKLLSDLYLPDHFVEDCDERHKFRIIPVLLGRVIKLLFFATLALPGAILFSPVFICSKVYSSRKAEEALAGSTVKVKANDVVATWKILIAMVFAPLVYSFYACIGTWWCYRHNVLENHRLVAIWLLLYLCGVLITYSALVTGEQGMDIFKSIRPLYLSITSGSSITELKKQRQEVSQDITNLVNEFGPQLFPQDFNLLEMRDRLRLRDTSKYPDDEKDEGSIQQLRQRRGKLWKDNKALKELGDFLPEDLQRSYSNELSSNGLSAVNSDTSLTNMPIFSDYHLHANARESSASLASSFRGVNYSNGKHLRTPSTSTDETHNDEPSLELHFGKYMKDNGTHETDRKNELSSKITQKVKDNRSD